MTNEDLQALCADWQKRLRLQDWDVSVRFADWHEFEGRMVSAMVFPCGKLKAAEIILRKECDYKRDELYVDYAPEFFLVHELLELHYEPFKARRGTRKSDAQEQSINMIAKALVQAVREKL